MEITEVVLTDLNIVNNNYKWNSRFLYAFVLNKWFDQLLNHSPSKFIFLKTSNSEFSYIEVSFIDENSNALEIEDKINVTLVIN